jgi:hypothetical protein
MDTNLGRALSHAVGSKLIGIEHGKGGKSDYIVLRFDNGIEFELSADQIVTSEYGVDKLELVATITKWEPEF